MLIRQIALEGWVDETVGYSFGNILANSRLRLPSERVTIIFGSGGKWTIDIRVSGAGGKHEGQRGHPRIQC